MLGATSRTIPAILLTTSSLARPRLASSRSISSSAGCRRPQPQQQSAFWVRPLRVNGGSNPTRPRWSTARRRTLLLLTFGGAVTLSGRKLQQLPDTVGPIYSFEEFDEGSLGDDDARLPIRYDALRIKQFWDKRPWQVISRANEIFFQLGPFFSKLIVWECLIRRKIFSHEGLQQKYAKELREILTELGPCFIKLGQALSIRPDLLPTTVLVELQKLCDAVPSFPTKLAIEVMRSELGRNPEDLFEDFGQLSVPIAAASLGQVYKLKLRSTGAIVAVKVQRPDMLAYILRDLYILRRIAQCLEAVKKVITNHRPYDVSLLDSFATASLLELDYLNEASNQERFRKDLEPKMGGRIYIPRVYRDLSTWRVLVSEWVEGQQLARSPPDVVNRLISVGVECFLIQLLEIGYFHADPHPGNLLVTKDGRLALIDFGLCAEVPLPDTKTITLGIVHLMQGDMGALVTDAVALGFLPQNGDFDKLRLELQKVYDDAQLALEGENRASAGRFKAVVRRRKRFMAVSFELNKIFFKYPFLVPDYFALITRAMIVLEGIAVTGDPEFDLFGSAYPYALKQAITLFGVTNIAHIAKEAVAAQVRMNSGK